MQINNCRPAIVQHIFDSGDDDAGTYRKTVWDGVFRNSS